MCSCPCTFGAGGFACNELLHFEIVMDVDRFEIELGALQVFTNDERTRSFLALEVVTGTAEVRGHGNGIAMGKSTGIEALQSSLTCCHACSLSSPLAS